MQKKTTLVLNYKNKQNILVKNISIDIPVLLPQLLIDVATEKLK